MSFAPAADLDINTTLQDTNDLLAQMPLVKECLENVTFKTLTTIFTSLAFCTTIFGNLLVIVSILKYKEFHKGVTHKLILQVAIADLVLLVVLITYPIEKLKPSYFRIPMVCLIRSIFTSISFSASITFLTFISIDRFLAVKFPLRHMVESKKTPRIYTLIVIVWIISIFTGVIVIKQNMFDKYGYEGRIDGCPVAWYSSEILLAISTVFILISFAINFISYAFVIQRLMQRNSEFNFESKQKQMTKTRLLLFVYVAFTIFWSPFLICQTMLLASQNDISAKCYREYFFHLGFLNSGMNWIFYGFGNVKYREAFGKLLCPCRTKQHVHAQSAGNF